MQPGMHRDATVCLTRWVYGQHAQLISIVTHAIMPNSWVLCTLKAQQYW
jgi:hypothetical protein